MRRHAMMTMCVLSLSGCTTWRDHEWTLGCRDCARHVDSNTCLREFGCGWCANLDNPLIGRCLEGQFESNFFNSGSIATL